ncbi:hypothetical protein OKA05_05980 [Luteolibacter arcticus]|uniref:PEP-CTERM protein-sorting domain-containing protein n=1 Tax=Luteolibacter arcticus TaxID=1581411 RepID=A0ABT3GF95_9BACT|nr:PEP-CTERM sorting domain-containing protein [Luteolibacter arcticus]MCW1922093.1 hypothetical protein [Luteolibacter arcticus]
MAASLVGGAEATITLNTQFGTAFDSSGQPVPAGTLYALVIDTNLSDTFAGGFGLQESLGKPGADAVFTPGQTISLGGNLSGDTIFYLGAFDGAAEGITAETIQLTVGVNGVATIRNFAIYWFPGATLSSANSATIGTQVGGMHAFSELGTGLESMTIPSDGSLVNIGAATLAGGGTTPPSRFTAVDLVPEPSTAFLGILGVFGLLRRRR